MSNKNRLFFVGRTISSKLGDTISPSIKKYIKEKMIERQIRKHIDEKKMSHNNVKYDNGVNLIGSIKAEMGLGQSCRLLANMIRETDYKLAIYNYDFSGEVKENDITFDDYITNNLPYRINIFHVNPCELGKLFMKMPDAWMGRYNIAFWLWELEEFPKEWGKYCELFDEIWTPSEFAAGSIRKAANIPVKVLPYYVTAPYHKDFGRKEFLLPENQFLFLLMYDINSTEGRKNPQGAIKAYKKAFKPTESKVGLVIKVNNGNKEQLRRLREQLIQYKNVYYITETISKEKVNSLIKCSDVFVSLHRAEGFGLVMAEAMILGTPVIATNWSSNTEFMNKESACMVDCAMIENPKTEGLYPKGCVWAEPNCEQAAEYMKKLWSDRKFYRQIRISGEKYISKILDKALLIEKLRGNLDRVSNEYLSQNK